MEKYSLVELSAPVWPLKENGRKGRQFSRESSKGGVKWRAGAEGSCLSPWPVFEIMFMNKDIVTPEMYKILGHWSCVTKFNMTLGK